MKKITIILMCAFTILLAPIANASVDTMSVTTYAKGSTVNAYVKNNENKQSHTVKLELQKDGKSISQRSVTVKKNEQLKVVFNLSSKGTYRIKYTVKNKSEFTAFFNK